MAPVTARFLLSEIKFWLSQCKSRCFHRFLSHHFINSLITIIKSYHSMSASREMQFIVWQKQTGTRRAGKKRQRKQGKAKKSRNGHRQKWDSQSAMLSKKKKILLQSLTHTNPKISFTHPQAYVNHTNKLCIPHPYLVLTWQTTSGLALSKITTVCLQICSFQAHC